MIELPHATGGSSLEGTVKAIREQQQRQQHQLDKQRQSIAELQAQLAAVLEEFQEKGASHNTTVDVRASPKGSAKAEDAPLVNADDAVPEYQVEHSMWDALLLVFFESVGWPDKALLILGSLMNLGLQAMMLLVLWFDMVDKNKYGSEKVEEMLKWRVATGHNKEHFDEVQGKPLIQKLCSRELWSFEQSEYDEMYDYLYKTVPGTLLSCTVLILWVLSSMVEYRRIVEQGLAILQLPSIRGRGLLYVVEDDEQQLEVRGARPLVHAFIVACLLLPRFVVLGFLCVGGCKYLAETASLSDLVLNAMGLAFILDVDELLCAVLLPHRLRSRLDRMRPLPCGERGRRVAGFSVTDWLRYLLTVALVLGAIFVYLSPFMTNLRGAATALCGGMKDFSYSGGISSEPTVTLMNSSDYTGSCGLADMDAHMSSTYGIVHNQSTHVTRKPVDYLQKQERAVLAYAFKGCDPGLLTDAQGACVGVPSSLADVLPPGVRPGANADPASCPVLQPRLRARACDPVPSPDSCLWSWRAYTCEEDKLWPGNIHEEACSSDLGSSCMLWRFELGMEHPTRNCLLADECGGPRYDCLSAYGTVDIEVRDYATYKSNRSLVWESVTSGLEQAINVSGVHVELQPEGRPAGSASQYFWLVRSMPDTFFPAGVPSLDAAVRKLANAEIAAVMGASETLDAVVIGSTEYTKEKDLRLFFQKASLPSSGGAPAGGGPAPQPGAAQEAPQR